jgi:hypothetical protein
MGENFYTFLAASLQIFSNPQRDPGEGFSASKMLPSMSIRVVSTVGKNMFLDCGYSCLVVGTQGHSGKSMVLVLVYYALKRVVVLY